MHGRSQRLLAQVFCHQGRDVAQVLRRLVSAHHQAAGGRRVTARVHVPGEFKRAQSALPTHQPGLQAGQQALDTGHQREAMGDQRVQLQFFLELFGQHQPVVCVWSSTTRPVQRGQQAGTKTSGHTVTRELKQVVPGAAAGTLQHVQVGARGAQGVHGQLTSPAVCGQAQLANRY